MHKTRLVKLRKSKRKETKDRQVQVAACSVELKLNDKNYKSLREVSIRTAQVQTLAQQENHLQQLKVQVNVQVLQTHQMLLLDLTDMEAQVGIRAVIIGLHPKHQLPIRLLPKHQLPIRHRPSISQLTAGIHGRDRTLQTKLLYQQPSITQISIKQTHLKMRISTDLEATVERESILNNKLIRSTALV